MKATVQITLKPGLLDAQGKTIKSALESLGFSGIRDVRVGKLIELELNHRSPDSATRDVVRMCQQLLANPVVETYHIEVEHDRILSKSRAG
jgi:phosphoribosylformylglycinamidine synthase